jgi:hypothetical protein
MSEVADVKYWTGNRYKTQPLFDRNGQTLVVSYGSAKIATNIKHASYELRENPFAYHLNPIRRGLDFCGI